MQLVVALAAHVLVALVVGLTGRRLGRHVLLLAALAPAIAFGIAVSATPAVLDGEVVRMSADWVPGMGLTVDLALDAFGLLFWWIIAGVGVLIMLYAWRYFEDRDDLGRFAALLVTFAGAMLLLTSADDVYALFVAWEITSITSYLLIGFNDRDTAARASALQALLVTGGGGLALLGGLVLVSQGAGTSSLSGILAAAPTGGVVEAGLVLVLLGAMTKSAQVPFHFWLPGAMSAPTPVSAYLHSATMVKAGVYLLMRLNPALGDTAWWETILPVFGGTTLLVGTLLAIRQTDLKLMLAYTTVASLGLLVMLTGFGSEIAVEAAVLYLIAHSMFKGALFMVAGLIDHESGTRDVTRLGGLRGAMPITFAAAMMAAISMGGLPPFFGFLAKEEIYAALNFAGGWNSVFTLVAIAGNALMFVIGFAVAIKPFFGELRETPKHPHEGPVLLWLGPLTLAVVGLATAVFSGLSHQYLSSPMASAVAGTPVEVYISIVPHVGLPLILSVVTVLLGVAIYVFLDGARATMAGILRAIGWGPDRGFDQFMRGLVRFSAGVTNIVQNGRLEVYMTVTFIMIALALWVPMIGFGELPTWPEFPDLAFYEWTIILIAVIGLGAVAYAADRLTAIVSLGIQGFAVALLFMLFGAPDLSFTQFMVETLSVVILALAMTRLRLHPSDHRPTPEKLLDVTVAGACGAGFAMLLLKVTQIPFDATLSEFFNTYSYVVAHGRNVVNVIIVDFRGLDTLGEIAVVMIAGLAILALIRIRVPRSGLPAEREG